MTNPIIPAEAIEAAAMAHYQGHNWDGLAGWFKQQCLDYAQLALEAAAPHMFAQAMEDAVQAFPLETIVAPDNAVVWMMRRAEALRGDA